MENLEYQKTIVEKMRQSNHLEMSAVDVVFSSGGRLFKFAPGSVESISEVPAMVTPVPGAPRQVIGLAFVRGASRVILDIDSWLDSKEAKKGRHVANLRGRPESIVINLVYETEKDVQSVQILDIVQLLKEKDGLVEPQ